MFTKDRAIISSKLKRQTTSQVPLATQTQNAGSPGTVNAAHRGRVYADPLRQDSAPGPVGLASSLSPQGRCRPPFYGQGN